MQDLGKAAEINPAATGLRKPKIDFPLMHRMMHPEKGMESRRLPRTVGTENQRDWLQRHLLDVRSEGFEIGNAERFELHVDSVGLMVDRLREPLGALVLPARGGSITGPQALVGDDLGVSLEVVHHSSRIGR